jgi:hypothetical protein
MTSLLHVIVFNSQDLRQKEAGSPRHPLTLQVNCVVLKD